MNKLLQAHGGDGLAGGRTSAIKGQGGRTQNHTGTEGGGGGGRVTRPIYELGGSAAAAAAAAAAFPAAAL